MYQIIVGFNFNNIFNPKNIIIITTILLYHMVNICVTQVIPHVIRSTMVSRICKLELAWPSMAL